MKHSSTVYLANPRAVALAVLGSSLLISPSLRAQATHVSADWAQTTPAASNGDSLSDYLVRLHSSLTLLKGRAELEQPLTLSAYVTAESRSGVRRLNIRNFQFLSDGPRAIGEYNLGAGSWPTLVGVLGSAVAEEFLLQAAVKSIPIEELTVVFTSTPGTARSTSTGTQVTYPRNLAYTAYIVSPATDAALEDLRQTVEKTSPVIDLITRHRDIVAHGALEYTQTPATRPGKTLEGLREFLAEKRRAAEGAVPAEGAAPRTVRVEGEPPLRAVVQVEGSTGIRNIRTDSSNFQLLHDNPRYLAGHNIGPVAAEHLVGVMITCLTHIYEIQAARLGIALDTLRLENNAVISPRFGSIEQPPRYQSIRYSAHIGSPEPKERILELQKAVESICPVYNLLKDSEPIKGTLVHARYQDPVKPAAAP